MRHPQAPAPNEEQKWVLTPSHASPHPCQHPASPSSDLGCLPRRPGDQLPELPAPPPPTESPNASRPNTPAPGRFPGDVPAQKADAAAEPALPASARLISGPSSLLWARLYTGGL
ncbi:uncharacterized protein LOC133102645 [Eubalaena glacialis]|uniref:uncharacterized protein LOC133102645 n=1 Tax=Eubalaena glacialis TaxID=27606 RepID=UPI002A59F055|nr:uncharacterized protein LOC133102645 [Eubalaena glacialis]